MSKPAFPNSWVETSFGEVFRVSGGSQPPKSTFLFQPAEGYVQLLQIRDFGEKPVPTFVRKDSVSKFCTEDDILIARYGASLGRILTGMSGAYNVALAKVIFDRACIDSRYVFYYLKTPFFQTPLTMMSRSAQNGFSEGELRDFVFPLPPLAEQKRIVAKIEELFSELEAGEESLRVARRQIGAYRQSLLKQAFEGKLTEKWRTQNPAKLESPAQLLARIQSAPDEKKRTKKENPPLSKAEVALLRSLPSSWHWCRVSDAGQVQLGRQRSPQHSTGDHMRKYLPVANVFVERIDTSDVLEMNFTPSEFVTFKLRPGDILLNEGQSLEWVGRPAMFRDELPDCCFQNTLVRFRAHKWVDAKYALRLFVHYLRSGRFQKIAKWTNNIAHLGGARFAELEFPLCSLPEQQEIVGLLDEQFEVIERNEREIDAALKRSEALRQAILKKAFTGRLVPQDPADEPASTLLARLRAGREDAATQKRGRRNEFR